MRHNNTRLEAHHDHYPQDFKINGNNIYLPKLGWYRFRKSREIEGTPKNVTISYTAGHWYVSIQTEYEKAAPQHPATSLVGIDLGIKRFATLSTGQYFKPRNYFRKLAKKLARAQKGLERKQQYSNNWKKQKLEIQKIYATIANARRDYLHWCSNRISKNHVVIVQRITARAKVNFVV